ncbi:hypothetical protein QVD17_34647 [Tagetes erecta]|uniref:Uncharacterized protein n=1 Tax=Tagetes erecta TaxID=13708 RepID=A0AAD8NKI9_TARER|nr:hypothetical protein QVD17_34647 [Tagetes erecta]
MALKASVVMIYIGMMMLLLFLPNNHAKLTEYSPAPQPQPPSNSSMVLMGPLQAALNLKSVHQDAPIGARKPPLRSRACFFAKSVVRRACVCLPGPMVTNNTVLVITHGRPREEVQNALESSFFCSCLKLFSYLFTPIHHIIIIKAPKVSMRRMFYLVYNVVVLYYKC